MLYHLSNFMQCICAGYSLVNPFLRFIRYYCVDHASTEAPSKTMHSIYKLLFVNGFMCNLQKTNIIESITAANGFLLK